MTIRIEKYQSSDFLGIKKIIDETYDVNISQDIIENIYCKNGHFIVVAHMENNVVGVAFVDKRNDYIRNRSSYFVSYVAVDLQFRHCGIGRAIFTSIEKMAAADNVHIIELTSADFRKGAHKFYENIGFTKKKTTVFINDSF